MPIMVEGAIYRTRDGNSITSPVGKTSMHGNSTADYWWTAYIEGQTRTFTNTGLLYANRENALDLVEMVGGPCVSVKPVDQMTLDDWRTNIGKMWSVFGAGL